VAGKSLKAAPRREVLEVIKVGDWGEVVYHHRLTCGHTETRKRQSPASHIACSGCVVAREFAQNGPARPLVADAGLEGDDLDLAPDEFGSIEAEAQRVVAGLAAKFGISTDAVDVAISAQGGRAELGYAIVFLDAPTARRLAYDLTGGSNSGRMLDKHNRQGES
jgi:hypothetical protein